MTMATLSELQAALNAIEPERFWVEMNTAWAKARYTPNMIASENVAFAETDAVVTANEHPFDYVVSTDAALAALGSAQDAAEAFAALESAGCRMDWDLA